MFKKSLQIIGLFLVISFSFYYTDKVVTVVRNHDPLMIKIKSYESIFNRDSIDAFIENNSVIPGINACYVDTSASYSNMKRLGEYNSNMIEYKETKPKLSIENIYDKYIVKGNKDTFEVALIFKINNPDYILDILNTLRSKNVIVSFFIDGKVIEENSDKIFMIINQGHEIYNLGYDHKYDKDLLVWTNNMIENMSHNKSNYCLVSDENKKVLEMCSSNKMYTIKPSILINYGATFTTVMNDIDKGSIIAFDTNDNTIDELNKTLIFLNSKGYKYNALSNHLSEKGCIDTDN